VQTLGGGSIDRRGQVTQIGQGQRIDQTVDAATVEAGLQYVNGACSFVRRAFIEQVGLMSEDYFLYFEELDWAMRAKGRFRLGYSPAAIVHHHVGKSIGTSDDKPPSPLAMFYLTASHIRFCSRYWPRALPYLIPSKIREAGSRLKYGQTRQSIAMVCGLLRINPALVRKAGVF
jgi:GT2 family glycosyltransferase